MSEINDVVSSEQIYVIDSDQPRPSLSTEPWLLKESERGFFETKTTGWGNIRDMMTPEEYEEFCEPTVYDEARRNAWQRLGQTVIGSI